MKSVLSLVCTLVLSTSVFAGELDKEVINQALQGTAVVRIDNRTSEVSVLNTEAVVSSAAEAVALTGNEFSVLPTTQVRSELDRDGGTSSWYVYWYNYSYSYTPVYAHYGQYWQPYYTYRYNYYTYYYYGHCNRWW